VSFFHFLSPSPVAARHTSQQSSGAAASADADSDADDVVTIAVVLAPVFLKSTIFCICHLTCSLFLRASNV